MKTLIRVGHSSYSGANALRLCFSKAQAIRVLRNRGVTRDKARKAINKTMADGGATLYGEFSQVIETSNEDFSLRDGYYLNSYKELRRKWSASSEL